MNALYAKTILYLYSGIDDFVAEIDKVVLDKAISSMDDYSPAIEQCLNLMKLTEQKEKIILLIEKIKQVLDMLKPCERAILDYNYIKEMKEEEYSKYDFKSRNYFRKKKVIVDKFSSLLEEKGITDEVFKEDYLSINMVKNFYKGVCVYEDELNVKSTRISERLKGAKEKSA